MTLKRLLIANRGEIALRIIRAAAELDIHTVAVFSADDAQSLHTRQADQALALGTGGVAAYLDGRHLIDLAKASGCDAIHPGYGFLSENADFARQCAEQGLIFVGPRPEVLAVLGDKTRARALAQQCEVPIMPGTSGPTTLEQATGFLAGLSPGSALMIKAVAGGGGRGMRVVRAQEELAQAYARCQSEARAAFGCADLYVERLMPHARHLEVQVAGDGSGAVTHLWERECSLQRRHQKLIEIAPSPGLPPALREQLLAAACRIASALRYDNLGTFEFLVDASTNQAPEFAFIEANPRLQVEHTVTEEVTGLDLVALQLRLAAGDTLAELGIRQADIGAPRGYALQMRINAESIGAGGVFRPTTGTITAFEPAAGPGVRVDSAAYAGYAVNPKFDPLLAKLIVHSTSARFSDVVRKAYRALCEFKIEGVPNNIVLLQNLLRHPDLVANRVDTGFVEAHAAELWAATTIHPRLFFQRPAQRPQLAGVRVDPTDPLAVLDYGKRPSEDASLPTAPASPEPIPAPDNTVTVRAPMQGTIVTVEAREGDAVRTGQALLVMEAMKMEHLIEAECDGVVRGFAVGVGDAVPEGHPLAFIEPAAALAAADRSRKPQLDLDRERPDLAEVRARHALGLDAARPQAVERRRRTGQRTARENLADLCDPGSFVEYGPLTIAAQRKRRLVQELIERTPADGLVAGIGSVNGSLFPDSASRCVVMAYDYTVLAGTQGYQNHRKKDRIFELAERLRLPLVIFTEGGGGRPGDTDGIGVTGLDCMAFNYFARLSGLVPIVGIVAGRCFAGNAALLGCCDVTIAAHGSNIGMGGPAMIEGGGLGVFRPEEIGPLQVQVPNGVVDLAVADEAEAVSLAKKYLSYFQGALAQWSCADQRLLRHLVPENRLRVYDVRAVIETLADSGSVLELRRHFGIGMVTALIRIEGRPMGLVANNPVHLAGAIDSNGADKAARFMQLCDAFDLPLLFLCDTPGIMVGPEVEKTALVRHAARMFVTGASLSVPFFTIVLRKGYGLGAQAMAGGSFKAPVFTVSWPTGEFGGMGLEGAVKLGYRNDIAALEQPAQRRELFDKMVKRMYEQGKAVSIASHFELDDTIDPADSRMWISRGLRAVPPQPPRTGKKRPCIDPW